MMAAMTSTDWLEIALKQVASAGDDHTFSAPFVKALVQALLEERDENAGRDISFNPPTLSPRSNRNTTGREKKKHQ